MCVYVWGGEGVSPAWYRPLTLVLQYTVYPFACLVVDTELRESRPTRFRGCRRPSTARKSYGLEDRSEQREITLNIDTGSLHLLSNRN